MGNEWGGPEKPRTWFVVLCCVLLFIAIYALTEGD